MASNISIAAAVVRGIEVTAMTVPWRGLKQTRNVVALQPLEVQPLRALPLRLPRAAQFDEHLPRMIAWCVWTSRRNTPFFRVDIFASVRFAAVH
jgi:hypothetical protein